MTDSKNQSPNKKTSGSSDAPPAADGRQENRRSRGDKRGGRRDRRGRDRERQPDDEAIERNLDAKRKR